MHDIGRKIGLLYARFRPSSPGTTAPTRTAFDELFSAASGDDAGPIAMMNMLE